MCVFIFPITNTLFTFLGTSLLSKADLLNFNRRYFDCDSCRDRRQARMVNYFETTNNLLTFKEKCIF